jgi:hypothetical protein
MNPINEVMNNPHLSARVRSFRRGGDVHTNQKAMAFHSKYHKMIVNRPKTEKTLRRWEGEREYRLVRHRMANGLRITPAPRTPRQTGRSVKSKHPEMKRL